MEALNLFLNPLGIIQYKSSRIALVALYKIPAGYQVGIKAIFH